MEVMNVAEAAEHLRVSEWLIREACKRRQLPNFRVGGRILFSRKDLDEWAADQMAKSVQPASKLKLAK